MKSRLTALLLALGLVCLAGCDRPAQPPAPSSSQTETTPLSILEDTVAALEPEDLTIWGYAMRCQSDGTPGVTAQVLLPLLRDAMEHRRADETRAEGEPYPGLWSLELYRGDSNTARKLVLSAGLTEDLVELTLSGSGTSVYLEDPELYRLLRTMRDDPTPPDVDQAAYERYRDVVDQHFDGYFADSDAQVDAQWELTTFTLQETVPVREEEYWLVGRVYYTDPPEDILQCLSGGSYVDSELRLHPVTSGYELLRVQGGKAQGIVYTAELTDLPA